MGNFSKANERKKKNKQQLFFFPTNNETKSTIIEKRSHLGCG
jgi:hypothetical protein